MCILAYRVHLSKCNYSPHTHRNTIIPEKCFHERLFKKVLYVSSLKFVIRNFGFSILWRLFFSEFLYPSPKNKKNVIHPLLLDITQGGSVMCVCTCISDSSFSTLLNSCQLNERMCEKWCLSFKKTLHNLTTKRKPWCYAA